MALKIVKKKNPKEQMKRKIGVITILGVLNKDKALYTKESSMDLDLACGGYKNMLPLLYDSFKDIQEATLIAIYTKKNSFSS